MSKLPEKTNGLLLQIFRKATFIGVFTYYDSLIFDTCKIELDHSLLFYFYKICSSMQNFHIEVKHLRSIFKFNKYPVNITDQCTKNFLEKLYAPKQIESKKQKKELLSHF